MKRSKRATWIIIIAFFQIQFSPTIFFLHSVKIPILGSMIIFCCFRFSRKWSLCNLEQHCRTAVKPEFLKVHLPWRIIENKKVEQKWFPKLIKVRCKMFENNSKYCIWFFSNFGIFANFCPIKTDLSGNTVWPQALGFQKLVKTDHFWHF